MQVIDKKYSLHMYMTIHCYPEQIINAYNLSKKEKIVLPHNNNNKNETKPERNLTDTLPMGSVKR